MTTYLAVLLVSFAISHFLTPLIHGLAYRVGALDVPSRRKIHSRITPRLGGLAVFIGFWGAFFLGLWLNPRFLAACPGSVKGMAYGSLVLLVLGVFDDIVGTTAWVKFPFQILAAAFAFSYGVRFVLLSDVLSTFTSGLSAIKLTYWTSYALTLLWIVGITNAMNFIDGLDALAGGLAFIVSVTLFIVAIHLGQFFYAVLYIALIGAVLGFGKYNKYPAKIFLGDTGSTFLGFTLACISIMACHKSTTVGSLLIPVVALGIPISDTTYAVLRRFMLGRNIFRADRGHLHHRLLEMGYSPKEVVWIIYILTICLSFGVFFLINAQDEFAALIVAMMTIGAFVIAGKLQLLNFELWKNVDADDGPFEEEETRGAPQAPPSEDESDTGGEGD